MLERKNRGFNMFVASAVQCRIHDLMVMHDNVQKHEVNENYQLSI